jgi:MFS family permease
MSRRYLIVAVTAVAALWMYIDRVCFSTLTPFIQTDLGMTAGQNASILGAFFLTYALCQIPVGMLADRYGPRLVLTIAIAAWSSVTMATGFAGSFAALLAIRLLLGVTEAGAYPAAAGLIKNWARPYERGRLSSVVALGGRVGGAIAPKLTTALWGLLTAWGVVAVFDAPGADWRCIFVLYGLCGLLVAAFFWLLVRDRPDSDASPPAHAHPFWNELRPLMLSIMRLARSRMMWLFGLVQLGVNIGWAFLITLLPAYLWERFSVGPDDRGTMQSVILATGCAGMVVGGLTTDWFRLLLGPRWGRALPLGLTSTGCAVLCFLVSAVTDPWVVTGLLAAMAFLVDLSVPCIWAFAQDVGGRKVGAALGWGNMWGNLAAWQSPILLTQVKLQAGWDVAFIVSGGFFVLAALCGLSLDARRPVDPADAN